MVPVVERDDAALRRAPSRGGAAGLERGAQPARGRAQGGRGRRGVRPAAVSRRRALDGHRSHRGALRRAARRTIRWPRASSSGRRTSSASRGSGSKGGDPKARAFWSLEEFRGDEPLRTGTRVNSFEEAFGAVAAGLAITCQAESAVRAVGAGFPQLRFVPLRGAPPAQVAVAWRTAHETSLARAFVRIALELAQPAARLTTPHRSAIRRDRCFPSAPTARTVGRHEHHHTHTHRAVEPYLAHQGEARWYGDSLFEFLVPSDGDRRRAVGLPRDARGGLQPAEARPHPRGRGLRRARRRRLLRPRRPPAARRPGHERLHARAGSRTRSGSRARPRSCSA